VPFFFLTCFFRFFLQKLFEHSLNPCFGTNIGPGAKEILDDCEGMGSINVCVHRMCISSEEPGTIRERGKSLQIFQDAIGALANVGQVTQNRLEFVDGPFTKTLRICTTCADDWLCGPWILVDPGNEIKVGELVLGLVKGLRQVLMIAMGTLNVVVQ
jgi:hypothetical protein